MVKKILNNVMVYVLFIAVLTALLFLSEFVPQQPIDANLRESMAVLNEESLYPRIFDFKRSAVLDNFTDSLILTVTKTSEYHSSPLSFLINPIVPMDMDNLNAYDPIANLNALLDGEAEADGTYQRYVLGFRIFLRPLLAVFNYSQIRLVLLAVLFLLCSVVFFDVCKNTNVHTAISFALAILAIRPIVISRCLQFTCCPVLALIAMLFTPKAVGSRNRESTLFLLTGAATMFFDFYTYPALTFGLPAVFAAVIKARSEGIAIKDILRWVLCWFAGYVITWLLKLSAVSLFTQYEGIGNGFNELVHWLNTKNTTPTPGKNSNYTAFAAIKSVFKVLIPDARYGIYYAISIFLLTVLFCAAQGNKYYSFKKILPILLIGLVPIIWYSVAPKPTMNHAFFQYRSIAVTLFALAASFFAQIPKENKKAADHT